MSRSIEQNIRRALLSARGNIAQRARIRETVLSFSPSTQATIAPEILRAALAEPSLRDREYHFHFIRVFTALCDLEPRRPSIHRREELKEKAASICGLSLFEALTLLPSPDVATNPLNISGEKISPFSQKRS